MAKVVVTWANVLVVLFPPQHPVLSNLQILLRQEATDISDPTQLATLLLKKVEVAIAVLPTTPTFRSVALEALLTTFKFCFTHKHTLVRHFISYAHVRTITYPLVFAYLYVTVSLWPHDTVVWIGCVPALIVHVCIYHVHVCVRMFIVVFLVTCIYECIMGTRLCWCSTYQ